jgi:hypothetical protein
MTPVTGARQGYTFGWIVACVGLSNLANPALVQGWSGSGGTLAGGVTAWSVVLGMVAAVGSVVLGLAAAAVRPWSWYVLMACHALGLAWIGLYARLVAPGWLDALVALAVGLPCTVFSFVYFYRRRAMFGAARRWEWLEGWWPRVAGPVTAAPGSSRGFTGLPWRYRLLVIVVVALLMMIGRG